MSSGGYRYGAGAPGWRGKCESFLDVDIRQLRASALLRPGAVATYQWSVSGVQTGSIGIRGDAGCVWLVYQWTPHDGEPQGIDLRVMLAETPCYFGGSRAWFTCPDCGRRCAVIYGPNRAGGFGCRICMDLAYSSEAEGRIDRCHRRKRKLERRLAGPHGAKPRRMHWRTYERICGRVIQAQSEILAGSEELLARLGVSLR